LGLVEPFTVLHADSLPSHAFEALSIKAGGLTAGIDNRLGWENAIAQTAHWHNGAGWRQNEMDNANDQSTIWCTVEVLVCMSWQPLFYSATNTMRVLPTAIIILCREARIWCPVKHCSTARQDGFTINVVTWSN